MLMSIYNQFDFSLSKTLRLKWGGAKTKWAISLSFY